MLTWQRRQDPHSHTRRGTEIRKMRPWSHYGTGQYRQCVPIICSNYELIITVEPLLKDTLNKEHAGPKYHATAIFYS